MSSCRLVARQKERPYQSKLLGLHEVCKTGDKTPVIPHEPQELPDTPQTVRNGPGLGHLRSSWGYTPIPFIQQYGPGRATKSGTDDTSSISTVDRRRGVVQKLMSNYPRRLQKSSQRRLYRQGTPDNGTNATPEGPGPSTAQKWPGHCKVQTA